MAKHQVVVPDIGGAEGAEVIELLVAVGDEVALDQGLIVLESDKASMEIPASAAGVVTELLCKEGDELAEGAPVALLEVADDAVADTDSSPAGDAPVVDAEPIAAKASEGQLAEAEEGATPVPATAVESGVSTTSGSPAAASAQPSTTPTSSVSSSKEVYAGPAVRKLAREFGVNLAEVSGSGPQQRILKLDVQRFVQQRLQQPAAAGGAALPEVPEMDFAQFGEVVIEQRSKLDKLTASNMQRSWLNVPHVTQFDNADITELEAFRQSLKEEAQRRDTRLTPLPFILKACAVALRDNPKLNASLSNQGEDIVYKQYVHIGMAVDTPAGLVVPVIRDVDKKTVWELAEEVLVLAGKARDRKLSPAEMRGGCFTISSLGNIGGTGFTPIVNTPEVGILGVSKATLSPVWNGTEFVPRKLLPLALSYDHRAVNGGDGGRFLSQVVELLSDIRRLSL